jgi:hypothetical protein
MVQPDASGIKFIIVTKINSEIICSGFLSAALTEMSSNLLNGCRVSYPTKRHSFMPFCESVFPAKTALFFP